MAARLIGDLIKVATSMCMYRLLVVWYDLPDVKLAEALDDFYARLERWLDMTFGICAIVYNEEAYIEEWIAFNLLQGAKRILLYDDGSTDSTVDIVKSIGTSHPVELITWAGNSQSFDLRQREVYKDAAWRLYRLDFVAFIDIDEFIYSATGARLDKELEKVPDDVSAIAVNQRVFGSSGNLSFGPGPVISRFVRCTAADHPENRWFKTIARPSRIVDFDSVHSVQLHFGRYLLSDFQPLTRSDGNRGCSDQIGAGAFCLNHYMLKSLAEFRVKQVKALHNGLSGRYSDEYFFARDTEHWANAVENSHLHLYLPLLADELDQLRKKEVI